MLTTTKKINLSGTSNINGSQAVFLSAQLSTDGSSNGSVSINITNDEIYKTNKTECRKDISDFQNQVYNLQDELEAEQNKETSVTE